MRWGVFVTVEPQSEEVREHNLGPQPLEDVLQRHSLSAADLVGASRDHLTFKMVQKGRKGRRLTPNVQRKILSALRTLRPELPLTFKDLFNY